MHKDATYSICHSLALEEKEMRLPYMSGILTRTPEKGNGKGLVIVQPVKMM